MIRSDVGSDVLLLTVGQQMRSTRKTLLGLATAVLTLVAVPPAAHATGEPTARWAYSVTGNRGRIELSATSDSAITEINAHLISYATGQEAAVVSDFSLTSGNAANGVWQTNSQVQLANLGSYRIDVDLTDADGDHSTTVRAGDLAYFAVAIFDPLVTDRMTVDYSHREVQVTGRLNSRHPGTRAVTPLGGAGIWISLPYPDFDQVDTVTAADGTFVATVDIKYAGEIQAASYYNDNTTNVIHSQSNSVEIAIDEAEARVSAELDRQRVDKGASVTLTGKMEWKSPDGWQPVANGFINVLHEPKSSGQRTTVGGVSTDAEGHYQLTHTPWESGTYRVTAPSDSEFVATAVGTTAITVLQPVAISEFKTTRSTASAIQATGLVIFGNESIDIFPVDIEYSADGMSWSHITTVTAHGWDGRGGVPFNGTVPSREAGYWRAHFQETDNFQSAISAVAQVA